MKTLYVPETNNIDTSGVQNASKLNPLMKTNAKRGSIKTLDKIENEKMNFYNKTGEFKN